MPILLKVRGISAFKYKSEDFALTTIYISGFDKKCRKVYVSIICKLYLVDRSKINMLVDNDILCIESFTINLSIFSAFIHSCDMKIDINAKQHSKLFKHRTSTNMPTIILPCLKVLITF